MPKEVYNYACGRISQSKLGACQAQVNIKGTLGQGSRKCYAHLWPNVRQLQVQKHSVKIRLLK